MQVLPSQWYALYESVHRHHSKTHARARARVPRRHRRERGARRARRESRARGPERGDALQGGDRERGVRGQAPGASTPHDLRRAQRGDG